MSRKKSTHRLSLNWLHAQMSTATLCDNHSHRPATGLGVEDANDAGEAAVEIGAGGDVLCDVSFWHQCSPSLTFTRTLQPSTMSAAEAQVCSGICLCEILCLEKLRVTAIARWMLLCKPSARACAHSCSANAAAVEDDGDGDDDVAAVFECDTLCFVVFASSASELPSQL
jgi:hypothetical protein